jgi:hypothetical protein
MLKTTRTVLCPEGRRPSQPALLAGQSRQHGGFLNRLTEVSHIGDAALAIDHGGLASQLLALSRRFRNGTVALGADRSTRGRLVGPGTFHAEPSLDRGLKCAVKYAL